MSFMKRLLFAGDSVVQPIDVQMPSPGPGEVVLKMKASGICGSDLRNFRLPKTEKPNISELKAPGHEPTFGKQVMSIP